MSDFAVARYLQNGSLDPAFSNDGKVIVPFAEASSRAFSVVVDSLDRVVAAGSVSTPDTTVFGVLRLLPSGELDPAFGGGTGKALAEFVEGPAFATAVTLDLQGRIVAAGRLESDKGAEFAVVRFLDTGELDSSFSDNGEVRTQFEQGIGAALGVSVDTLGRIVVAGWVDVGIPGHAFGVLRYLDDGSLDPMFSGDGKVLVTFQGRDEAFGVKHDARGRIVLAGESRVGSTGDAAMARLRPDGSLDVTFGVNGRAYSDLGGLRSGARGVALDRQNRIVIAGHSRGALEMFGAARVLSHGDHDQTFAGQGRVQAGFFDTEGAESVAIDRVGRIVMAGSTGALSEGTVFALTRFLPDGNMDGSFGLNGIVTTNFVEGVDDRAHAVAVDSQDRVIAAGGVDHARDWPLRGGPFHAGERTLHGVQVTPNSARLDAVVYYPATAEGVETPFAVGAPFPLIGFAHANRNIGVPACPGTPTDFSQDYRQLSVILRHLARWGYVVISTDQSADILVPLKAEILEASVRRMLKENEQGGSPFKGKVRSTGIILMGHSAGGGAAIETAATVPDLDVVAVATLAPGVNSLTEAAQVGGPLLVVLGTNDSSAVSGNGQQVFDAGVAPKHLVRVSGANHFGFTDELCAQGDGPPTIARGDQQKIALAYVTAFLQRYIKNEISNASYLDGSRKVETLENFGISVQANV